MKIRYSLLLLFLAAFGLTALGQTVSNTPTFEVRTNLLVLDDKDQYATGVKRSDIHIYQDGVEQTLTQFAVARDPLGLSLVVDNSGSVRPQLDDVTKLTKTLIANLGPEDDAQLIRFVGRDHIEIIEKWTKSKKALWEAADNMYVEGGQTAATDALYLATQDIIDRKGSTPDRRYVIVLISDGEDRNSYYTRKDLLKLLAGTNIQVFTIALTKDLGKTTKVVDGFPRLSSKEVESLSNDLAALTGGTSYFVRNKLTDVELKTDLLSLMGEWRSQFRIGYSTVLGEHRSRKLTVSVDDGPDGEKRKGIIKETIVLPEIKK